MNWKDAMTLFKRIRAWWYENTQAWSEQTCRDCGEPFIVHGMPIEPRCVDCDMKQFERRLAETGKIQW
jgi:hypothetical protein